MFFRSSPRALQQRGRPVPQQKCLQGFQAGGRHGCPSRPFQFTLRRKHAGDVALRLSDRHTSVGGSGQALEMKLAPCERRGDRGSEPGNLASARLPLRSAQTSAAQGRGHPSPHLQQDGGHGIHGQQAAARTLGSPSFCTGPTATPTPDASAWSLARGVVCRHPLPEQRPHSAASGPKTRAGISSSFDSGSGRQAARRGGSAGPRPLWTLVLRWRGWKVPDHLRTTSSASGN